MNLDRVLRLTRRELQSLTAEKTIILALAIQLFVAAFSSFLVVGLATLYDPGSADSGDVTFAVAGEASDELVAAAARHERINVERYPSEQAALRAFDAEQVSGTLVANPVETGDGTLIGVDATVPESSLQKTLIVVQIRTVLETVERETRLDRTEYIERSLAPLPADVGGNPQFDFSYTILLPLLLLLPAFIAGSTAVDSVTEEIERGTLDLLRVAPLSLVEIVTGKGLAMAMLAPMQALVWLVLLSFNGFAIAAVPLLLVYTGALATLLVAVGVGLALAFASRQRAQLLYSLSALAVFALAGFLPEHPATTIAHLAIDSATPTTYALVAATVVGAVAGVAAIRSFITRIDPESL
ncbi:MAG: ABC transporter permease [Halobacteriales archaeon]|nr:ABC transporter permease [Halobacteriales archaeon]